MKAIMISQLDLKFRSGSLKADVMNNRRERLAVWRVASGRAGLVNQALAAWLLDVSHQRVAMLVAEGRLECRQVNQVPLVTVSSVAKYAMENRLSGRPKSELDRGRAAG